MHATGGQLELPKCFYNLLHWVFDSIRTGYPDLHPAECRLARKDIAQRCYQESHRRLGVHENPAGIYKTEYTHLLTK
jgi:hypothetical protein